MKKFNDFINENKITDDILKKYNQYDLGEIDDIDAAKYIINILKKNHPDKISEIEKKYKMYNDGDIDGGDLLMKIMNIVEKIYPNIYNE